MQAYFKGPLLLTIPYAEIFRLYKTLALLVFHLC